MLSARSPKRIRYSCRWRGCGPSTSRCGTTRVSKQRVEATFVVRSKADSIAIIASLGEAGTHRLSVVKLRHYTLTFWLSSGGRADCTLVRHGDGAFEGPCAHPRTARVRALMEPPKAP